MNEAETRAEHIDPALKAAGRDVVEGSRVLCEHGIAIGRLQPGAAGASQGCVPKNGGIFFTIFQTFMSGPGGAPYFGEYPQDFFDYFVTVECYPGGANDEGRWRAILDYFSAALQLGHTVTPKRTVNADTYAYFGAPVYQYSLKEGINEGFLKTT